MTVAELIAQLSELPDYYPVDVEVVADDGEWSMPIESVENAGGAASLTVTWA